MEHIPSWDTAIIGEWMPVLYCAHCSVVEISDGATYCKGCKMDLAKTNNSYETQNNSQITATIALKSAIYALKAADMNCQDLGIEDDDFCCMVLALEQKIKHIAEAGEIF